MKTLNQLRITAFLLVLIALYFILPGCAPVFSELQSARTVGEGNYEFTPSYSSVNFSNDGETEGIQNHLGVQIAYGISDKWDLRARYERVWLKGDMDTDGGIGEGWDVIGIGPKYSVIKNKFAVALPIGRALGMDTEDTWEIHPTILLTAPIIMDKVEITFAPKYLITLCDGCEDFMAVNVGLSLSSDLNRWAIRPEYGHLYNFGEDGHYGQFSIGFSWLLRKK